MADETVEQTVEEKARVMGWRPKEEYKGEAPWIDAQTFVERGETLLPIVNASNKRLRETVDAQNARLIELERQNRANAAALEAIQESNREQTVQNTQRTIEEIETGIAAAREAGNVQEELALLREHHTTVDKLNKAKQKPAPQQTQQTTQDATQTPEFQSFLRENPWWQTDAVMRAASIEINNELIRTGKVTSATTQAERLEMVAEATRQRFHIKDNGRRGGASRVESGGGNNSGSSGSTGKSYADLPAEAKAACDKAGKRMQIGEGKRYKTVEDWQKEYARIYYSKEA